MYGYLCHSIERANGRDSKGVVPFVGISEVSARADLMIGCLSNLIADPNNSYHLGGKPLLFHLRV